MLQTLPFRFDTNLGWQSVLEDAHDRLSQEGWMGCMRQINPNDFTQISGNPAYSEVSLGDNVDRYDFYLWDMQEAGYEVEAERKLYRDMLANHRFWGMVPIEEDGRVLVGEAGERISLRKGQYVFVLGKESVDDQVFRSANAILDGLRTKAAIIKGVIDRTGKITDGRYKGFHQMLGAIVNSFEIVRRGTHVNNVPDLYLSHLRETLVWDWEERCWVLSSGRDKYNISYFNGILTIVRQTNRLISEYMEIGRKEVRYIYAENQNWDESVAGVTFESGGKNVEIKVKI